MRTPRLSGTSGRPKGSEHSGSVTSQINLGEIEEGSSGFGFYSAQGENPEYGVFGFESVGPASLGIGVGLSPGTKEINVFVFASMSLELEEAGPSVENILVAGYGGNGVSGGAYTGRITALGSKGGIPGAHVAIWSGTETTTPAYPLDSLANALLDSWLGDVFKSIAGPLSDPSSLTDPFQEGTPRTIGKSIVSPLSDPANSSGPFQNSAPSNTIQSPGSVINSRH